MRKTVSIRMRIAAVVAIALALTSVPSPPVVSAAYSVPGPTYMGQVRSGSLTAYGKHAASNSTTATTVAASLTFAELEANATN